jgi:hypothetical protein
MSATVISKALQPQRSAADRAPLLRWMIFTGLTIFAATLLWRFGLIRLMIASDRTYISSAICTVATANSRQDHGDAISRARNRPLFSYFPCRIKPAAVLRQE